MKIERHSSTLRAAVRAAALSIAGLGALMGGVLSSTPAMAAASFATKEVNFDIPAQSLESALLQLSKQADVQVMIGATAIAGQKTEGVKGKLSVSEALSRLLSNTGLTFETVGNTVTVRAVAAAETNRTVFPLVAGTLLTSTQAVSADGTKQNSESDSPVSTKETLDEIVVTGTHVRGAAPVGTPVLTFTRDAIDQTGMGSIHEFIQRLPQDFRGGASEGTAGSVAGGGNSNNRVDGSGINLRGLGNDSTLILIDGRRVAPGNSDANFVDISLIPMSAVERIEIVTDGASAIYGSDAVGGVVNFILRRNYTGAETRVRYGAVSDGGSREVQGGQTFGREWGAGSALLSYEYYDRTPLYANDRRYTSEAVDPFTLLPEQVRHGAFLTVNQQLGRDVELFADAHYSRRSTRGIATLPLFTVSNGPTSAEAYGSTLGVRLPISAYINFEFASSYTESNSHVENQFNTFPSVNLDTSASILSADGKVDGRLWELPAGALRFAIGAQYREEKLASEDMLSGTEFEPRRDVMASFVELQVPIVGPRSTSTASNALEISLAGRYEDYSDFGTTFNPKFGVSWRPTTSLEVRGTYGRSFRAPSLNDGNPIPFQVVAAPEFDPVSGDNTNVLQIFGGNPALTPEKATTWTAGVDFVPEALPEFRASATYYSIAFRDRITNAQGEGFDVSDALRIENQLGPTIVQRSPPPSLVQSLASTPGFTDLTGALGGVDLATIGAIVDSRALNLSEVSTSGIDLSLSYAIKTELGDIQTGIDGTYILDFDKQFTATTPVVPIVDTPYNPANMKVRGRAILHRGSVMFAAYVNYIDSYDDNRGSVTTEVRSWTTGDVSIGYDTNENAGLLGNASVLLSIVNVTNADPPFVASSNPFFFPGINFDGANANVLGRFYSLQVTKHW